MKTSLRLCAGAALLLAALTSSCVVIHQNENTAAAPTKTKIQGDIPVYTSAPELRSYKEVSHYEAIGSNVSSFSQVLERIKKKAKNDGCEALVKVKFYRQQLGSGRHPSSFPTIEATGIRFTKQDELANN